MKRKALLIIFSSIFTLGLVFAYTTSYTSTKKSALQEYSQNDPSKRRCEKCKRGADGKMECVEVPCPK